MKRGKTMAVLRRCAQTGLKEVGRVAALLSTKAADYFRKINPGP